MKIIHFHSDFDFNHEPNASGDMVIRIPVPIHSNFDSDHESNTPYK